MNFGFWPIASFHGMQHLGRFQSEADMNRTRNRLNSSKMTPDAVPRMQHRRMTVVVSANGDPRVELVEEAVAFWNKTLAEAGSAFSLGRITHVVQSPPEEDLPTLSQSVPDQIAARAGRPESLRNLSGDITIFLAQSKFISFTSPFDEKFQARDRDSRRTVSAPEPAKRRAQRDCTRTGPRNRPETQKRPFDAHVRAPGAVSARPFHLRNAALLSADR
jgi:hypothetical protein